MNLIRKVFSLSNAVLVSFFLWFIGVEPVQAQDSQSLPQAQANSAEIFDGTDTDFYSRVGTATATNIIDRDGKVSWAPRIIKHNNIFYSFITEWNNDSDWRTADTTIVLYKSSNLFGPYTFVKDLSIYLKSQAWSVGWLHNCDIEFYNGKLHLYYIGSPTTGVAIGDVKLGVATATDPEGAWTPHPTNPIMKPRPGKWDNKKISNVSIFKVGNKYRMTYKGKDKDNSLRIGMAESKTPYGPWYGRTSEPNFGSDFDDFALEDVYVWKEAGKYWAVIKTFKSIYGIPKNGAILAVSNDGALDSFQVAPHAYALNRKIIWEESNQPESYDRVEFHFVYVDKNGIARAVANAVGDGAAKTGFSVIRELTRSR